MSGDDTLMIPGPVKVPKDILESMACQMFNHRGPMYARLLSEVREGIGWVLGTNGEVQVVTGSGTAGLEFAEGNCIHPGDSVLCLSSGVFGERLRDIAGVFGKDVKTLERPYGQAVLPGDVAEEMKKNDYDVVTCVFNESSTGVRNPVKEISGKVKEEGALFIVDNVSGVGMEYWMDKWGIDVTITATQKALGIPPGLSFVALSEKAREKAEGAPLRSYYFDYETYRDYAKKGQPPFTPCISAMVAAKHAIEKVKEMGLGEFNEIHRRRADAVRAASESLGLKLFAQEGYRSDTLTSIEHAMSSEIVEHLREKHMVIIGGGQKHLAGKVFRIGHMGDLSRGDFELVFKSIGEFLSARGEKVNIGEALKQFKAI